MSKRQGPALTIAASCEGCEWERLEYGRNSYEIDVHCSNPTKGGWVGHGRWHTPEWCAVLPEAKRKLAVTLAAEVAQ